MVRLLPGRKGPTMTDMTVRIGTLTLANPVMPASGTFAEGLAAVVDLNRLGALVTKTITRELRSGNPLPRVAEVQGGMLNAIGIPSKGVPYLLDHTLPELRRWTAPAIVSISAPTAEGFASLAADGRVPGVAGDRGQHLLPEYRGRRQGVRHACRPPPKPWSRPCAPPPPCRYG